MFTAVFYVTPPADISMKRFRYQAVDFPELPPQGVYNKNCQSMNY